MGAGLGARHGLTVGWPGYPFRRAAKSAVDHRRRRVADFGDSSRDRRANAGAWNWGYGYYRFSADERHRLAEALQPVAEADPDPAARAQAIAALVGLR